MNFSDFLLILSTILMFLGFGTFLYFTYIDKFFFPKNKSKTLESVSAFGDYIGGVTGPIFALAGFLIVYSTIIDNRQDSNEQKFETLYFKFLDHNHLSMSEINFTSTISCKEFEGANVWVPFRKILKKSYRFVDSNRFTMQLNDSQKFVLAYSIFFTGTPRSSNSNSRTINKFLQFFKNKNLVDSFIADLRSIKHCEGFSVAFGGYSNKLEHLYNQFFSYLAYVDNANNINDQQKSDYVSMLVNQQSNFSLAMLKFHINSDLSTTNQKKLSVKYNIFKTVDPILMDLGQNNDE